MRREYKKKNSSLERVQKPSETLVKEKINSSYEKEEEEFQMLLPQLRSVYFLISFGVSSTQYPALMRFLHFLLGVGMTLMGVLYLVAEAAAP